MSKPEQPGAPGGGCDRTDRSDRTDRTDRVRDAARQKGLRPSGGYRTLRSFQVTTVIYDATVAFCERFVDKRSRTRDQMVQAARSGRQNIAEGSLASAPPLTGNLYKRYKGTLEEAKKRAPVEGARFLFKPYR